MRILSIDMEFAQTYKRKLNKVSVMEFGAAVYDGNEYKVIHDELYNTVTPSRYATKVTGIDKEMIKDKPHISRDLDLIQSYIDSADVLVVHGAGDLQALRTLGITLNLHIENTHDIARSNSMYEKNSLIYLADYYNALDYSPHRAADDALATLKVYMGMIEDGHRPEFMKNENLVLTL